MSLVTSNSRNCSPAASICATSTSSVGILKSRGIAAAGGDLGVLAQRPQDKRVALDPLAQAVNDRLPQNIARSEAVGRLPVARTRAPVRSATASSGRKIGVSFRRSYAFEPVDGLVALWRDSAGAQEPSRSAKPRPSAASSAAEAARRGKSQRSAVATSIASIAADAWAAASVRPLPCETARVREFGRIADQTGMPIRSSPVMRARRVTPNSAKRRRIAATVSSAAARGRDREKQSRASRDAGPRGAVDPQDARRWSLQDFTSRRKSARRLARASRRRSACRRRSAASASLSISEMICPSRPTSQALSSVVRMIVIVVIVAPSGWSWREAAQLRSCEPRHSEPVGVVSNERSIAQGNDGQPLG